MNLVRVSEASSSLLGKTVRLAENSHLPNKMSVSIWYYYYYLIHLGDQFYNRIGLTLNITATFSTELEKPVRRASK